MKVRLRYAKQGRVRFTSHRDVARIFERSFRRLTVPVAYTEGFSPRPKISFGLALTVAHESQAEYLDVDLATSVDLEEFPVQLSAVLPEGIDVIAAAEVEAGAVSLQQAIVACSWEIEVLGCSLPEVVTAVETAMASPELPLQRERKGKTAVVDVRPAIVDLVVLGPTERGVALMALLATEPFSLRPTELVQRLHPDLSEGRVRRLHQWTSVEPEWTEPIGVPLLSTGHPDRRAP